MIKKRNIGILIFHEAEVLDFAGPFEVFSVASQLNNNKLFNVFTVSEFSKPIDAVNGLSVNPKYSFDNCPHIDILIIAGGNGTRNLAKNNKVLQWVKKIHQTTELTLSICSGSRVLGKLGLLDHQSYCTHNQVYESMAKIAPQGFPRKDLRFTSSGKIYTSGGISAGIDLSFHIVKKLSGQAVAQQTAEYMEYRLLDRSQ